VRISCWTSSLALSCNLRHVSSFAESDSRARCNRKAPFDIDSNTLKFLLPIGIRYNDDRTQRQSGSHLHSPISFPHTLHSPNMFAQCFSCFALIACLTLGFLGSSRYSSAAFDRSVKSLNNNQSCTNKVLRYVNGCPHTTSAVDRRGVRE
jgi:hypothetical protein